MDFFRQLGLSLALTALASAAETQEDIRFFEEKVRPLLAEKCYVCHSEQMPQPQGGLRLDSHAAILKGGNGGPALVAGHPERSLLMHVVSYEDEIKMPPTGKLSEPEIALLAEWIRRGAPGPASAPVVELADRITSDHWAFQPVKRPEPPPAASDWALTPIDRFIEARLAAEGLQPSPEADRRILIRRAYFDLLGLPPPADEVKRFIADESPEAYPALVDHLLASPQFGERWARYWLDVARYSDEGFQARAFPISWTYRDWVIGALNEDMPVDQFILRQLAADLIEGDRKHLAALGLLTVGINLPRPTDVPENLDDRIDVVTRGFLGLSAACARCHDHKYDPIPQKDYYSLYGVFLNSPDVLEAAPIEELPNTREARFYLEKLAMRREWIDRFKRGRLEDHKAEFRRAETLANYLAAAWEGRNVSDRALETLSKEKNLNLYLLQRWRDFLIEQTDAGNPLFQDLENRVEELARELAEASRPEPWPDTRREELRQVLWGPDAPTNVPFEDFWWIQNEGDSNVVKQLKWQYNRVMTDWSYLGGPRHAMIVKDAETLQPAFVFVRGNQHDKGARVERRFLSVLSDGEPFRSGSGRLELARAIASPENPLTARVYVNRVWQHLFGEGLVRTPSNFGTTGEPPTHPELLDYLASTFIEDGWSTKKLIRRIMLSRVYRQSSEGSPECAAADPTNRLLWRQNRRRMDFEALRDSMLAVAGRLDPGVGGPPFELAARPSSPRRTIYAYISREQPSGVMRSFDFSNPEQHTPERQLTTVPQQSLFLLNSPFAAEQARSVVRQLSASDPAGRTRELYWRILGRAPAAAEIKKAAAFVEQYQPPAVEEQPELPWRYGTAKLNFEAGKVEKFRPFEFSVDERLQHGEILPNPTGGHASLTANGGTPGDNLGQAVVRRWVSPLGGIVSISGEVKHPMSAQARRFEYSNGIRAWIISSDQGVLATWTLAGLSAHTGLSGLRVEEGETIDFVVDARGDYESDDFTWPPVIEETLTSEQKEAGQKPRLWSAADDFAIPKPEPLNAWEQYAQVLLLTNEFMFID